MSSESMVYYIQEGLAGDYHQELVDRVLIVLHVEVYEVCAVSEARGLVDSHPGSPTCLLLINVDLERERIAALCGDGRDVIFVSVGKGDDFHGGCKESLLHGATNFGSFYKKS